MAIHAAQLTVVAVHGDTDKDARQAYLDEQLRLKLSINEPEPADGWPVLECNVTLLLHDPAYPDDRLEILVHDWDLVTGLKAGDVMTLTLTR